MYLQEYEVDYGASSGELIYRLHEEAALVHSRDLPDEGTDYFALDPHPRVPFAALWGRVDRWGDLWIYREFWPSVVCFRYESGRLRGRRGDIPERDAQHSIKDFVETCWWLESDKNPQNKGEVRTPYKRVIDYAARAFGKGTQDDPEQPNFQQRIAARGTEVRHEKDADWFRMEFEDCKKGHDVGYREVNDWLKPQEVLDVKTDKWIKRSRLLICQDRCPELIYELKNNRHPLLTPVQAEKQDPTGDVVKKRNHLTDDLQYMVNMNPTYREPITYPIEAYRPPVPGLSY